MEGCSGPLAGANCQQRFPVYGETALAFQSIANSRIGYFNGVYNILISTGLCFASWTGYHKRGAFIDNVARLRKASGNINNLEITGFLETCMIFFAKAAMLDDKAFYLFTVVTGHIHPEGDPVLFGIPFQ